MSSVRDIVSIDMISPGDGVGVTTEQVVLRALRRDEGVLNRRASAKAERFVRFAAVRADEHERLEAAGGLAGSDELHGSRIDELAIAFEPDAVALRLGHQVRRVASGH